MDRLEMAVAMQATTERHERFIREAERRRRIAERRRVLNDESIATSPAPARLGVLARVAEHLHLATHRPMAH